MVTSRVGKLTCEVVFGNADGVWKAYQVGETDAVPKS